MSEEMEADHQFMYFHALRNGEQRVASDEIDNKIRIWHWAGNKWGSVMLNGPGGHMTKAVFSKDVGAVLVEDCEGVYV